MTWKEIKQAVEEAGGGDADEVNLIQCENGGGDKTFHAVVLGKALKLVENVPASRKSEDYSGCAV